MSWPERAVQRTKEKERKIKKQKEIERKRTAQTTEKEGEERQFAAGKTKQLPELS